MRAVYTALLVATILPRPHQNGGPRWYGGGVATRLKQVARFMSDTMNRKLSRGVTLNLALISILSCSDNSITGSDGISTDNVNADANRVATVTVTLASSSIAVGDTTRATADLRDYHNRPLTRIVRWSTSDASVATVDSTGLVTGVAEGTAVITATRGLKSGSATITVTGIGTTGTAPVASVTVSLAASSLNPGQTTQATATTYDSANNVLTGRAISWTSSDNSVATVSASGVVTAVAVGTSQIVATSEGKSGSATANVVAGQPPPGSNEPAGMTVITHRPFNALNELGWQDEDRPGGPYGSIVSDATAPQSPSSVLQIRLPAGYGEGGSPFSGDYTFPTNYRTIYVSYWAKFSDNWYGPSSAISKTFYLYTSLNTPSIYFDMDAEGLAPMQPRF